MKYDCVREKTVEHLPVIYLTKTMQNLYKKGRELAVNTSKSLCIEGENGTGKELLAKSIHYHLSPDAPFVTINCTSLSFSNCKTTIEDHLSHFSEMNPLLGHDGTGNQITLFFRDIGKLREEQQTELFQFLKELQHQPKPKIHHRQPRFVFTHTNNGIDQQATRSNSCLFAPFSSAFLSILPLRQRREDIHPLAHFFLDTFSKEYGKEITGIHSRALHKLEAHEWPNNVSELRDVIENAVLLAQNRHLLQDDIRFNISKKSIALESFLSREDFFSLKELETIYIHTVLKRVNNNKSRAAKILGISRNTLQRKIETSAQHERPAASRKKNGTQPLLF